MKIDAKSRRILELLALNCRTSHAVIGRAVNLSKDAVTYRVRQLEDSGVLMRKMLMIDARTLGVTVHHLLLRLDAAKDARDKYIRKLAKHEAVMWINSFVGRFDIQVIVYAWDIFHLNQIHRELFELCEHTVRDYMLLNHVADYEFTNLFPEIELGTRFERADDGSFSHLLAERSYASSETFAKPALSPLDFRLLDELAEDPCRSLTDLAEILGTDRLTVRKHALYLVHSNVIRSFAGIADQHHFGRTTYYLLVRVAANTRPATLKRAYKRLRNVFYAGAMLGDYDMILYLNAASPQELNRSIDVFRSELEENIETYELLVQDSVHYWRHVTKVLIAGRKAR